jgi:hypothetical protein
VKQQLKASSLPFDLLCEQIESRFVLFFSEGQEVHFPVIGRNLFSRQL